MRLSLSQLKEIQPFQLPYLVALNVLATDSPVIFSGNHGATRPSVIISAITINATIIIITFLFAGIC